MLQNCLRYLIEKENSRITEALTFPIMLSCGERAATEPCTCHKYSSLYIHSTLDCLTQRDMNMYYVQRWMLKCRDSVPSSIFPVGPQRGEHSEGHSDTLNIPNDFLSSSQTSDNDNPVTG